MSHLDPFPGHYRNRKFDIWITEKVDLEDLLASRTTDPDALKSDLARLCGGRWVDVQYRLKHVKKMLETSEMKTERRVREWRERQRIANIKQNAAAAAAS